MIKIRPDDRYGNLTVKKSLGKDHGSSTLMWECQCVCGRIIHLAQSQLTGRKVLCCGTCKSILSKKRRVKPSKKSMPLFLDINRNTWAGFNKYFTTFPYMFISTFGAPFSKERVREEWLRMQKFSKDKNET